MRACILNSVTKTVENIVSLNPEDFVFWPPYRPGVELAPRHDGEIGWQWDFDAEDWIKPQEPAPDLEILAKVVRRRRDAQLTKFVDRYNPLRWAELTAEQQAEIAAYRQALLDLPDQPGFPLSVVWPPRPQL